ncbi:hypothetical protein HK405_001440, partial [Cladochytrium tenue]
MATPALLLRRLPSCVVARLALLACRFPAEVIGLGLVLAVVAYLCLVHGSAWEQQHTPPTSYSVQSGEAGI